MSEAAITLPRGGTYIKTSAGPIQFGLPPETIKDSMALGLPVPTVYVVPHAMFDRQRGVNVSECEFPAYYNYFILKRRIRLLVDGPGAEARVRTVFREALFGPGQLVSEGEFSDEVPAALRPNFTSEFDAFRRGPDGKRLEVDTLVEFLHFDERGVAEVAPGVEVARLPGGDYLVRDGGREAGRAPSRPDLPARRVSGGEGSRMFEPPAFGITVLGASHGFDPTGKTTGFVVWIGGRGLLVDPPVDATENLREQGVPPKLIDGVILTHCHADHDSGTFQKILDEGRVNLYTTPTVLGSFLKKYSSLSAISEDLLRRTFLFTPAKIGAPTRVHGAELWFFYTLHSIPALGFEVFYGGKSLAFSGDTLYDPARIREFCERGVLSPERRDDLIDFPWHHTVVLHEAGVPPLHTPIASLAALPDEVKERLYLVHIAEKDVPTGRGLKAAGVGLEHTIRIEVTPPERSEAIDVLEAFCAVDLFHDFPLSRAGEILHVARPVRAHAGERIIEQGTHGDTFYLICSGEVSVVQSGVEVKSYVAGDYFGETALILDQPRNADVIAKTETALVAVSRYDFLYLLRGTDIAERLGRLAAARAERSWEVLDKNATLRTLTSGQKTQLQSFFVSRQLASGEVLWSAGELAPHAVLLDDAEASLASAEGVLGQFGAGALLGEFDAFVENVAATTTAQVTRPGRAFSIARNDFKRLLRDNPGIFVSLLGAKFAE